jgi:hypothetical protein
VTVVEFPSKIGSKFYEIFKQCGRVKKCCSRETFVMLLELL